MLLVAVNGAPDVTASRHHVVIAGFYFQL